MNGASGEASAIQHWASTPARRALGGHSSKEATSWQEGIPEQGEGNGRWGGVKLGGWRMGQG